MDDLCNPSHENLLTLSLIRCLKSANHSLAVPVPFIYPAGQTIRGSNYSKLDYTLYGDLEFEYERLVYTWSNHACRGIPTAMSQQVLLLLAEPATILSAWRHVSPKLRHVASVLARSSAQKMSNTVRERELEAHPAPKTNHTVLPDSCQTTHTSGTLSLKFWACLLDELVPMLLSDLDHLDVSRSFLEVFSFLRDPIGGLFRDVTAACRYFLELLRQTRHVLVPEGGSKQRPQHQHQQWPRVIAQIASEAIYLATPYVSSASYVHFYDGLQLLYSYVPIKNLTRAEFSDAPHVLDIINEILASGRQQQQKGPCSMAPVAVATYPRILREHGTDTELLSVIIDGNHRATAIMFLSFLASVPGKYRQGLTMDQLEQYCAAHHLGEKWQVDLRDVLLTLRRLDSKRSTTTRQLVRDNEATVDSFSFVKCIPALIVEEEVFHTVDEQRSSSHHTQLLLPMHQGLYNDPNSAFVLPQQGQRHGRPNSFQALPLLCDSEIKRNQVESKPSAPTQWTRVAEAKTRVDIKVHELPYLRDADSEVLGI